MQTSQSDRWQSGHYVKCGVSYTAAGRGLWMAGLGSGFALPTVIKWSINFTYFFSVAANAKSGRTSKRLCI